MWAQLALALLRIARLCESHHEIHKVLETDNFSGISRENAREGALYIGIRERRRHEIGTCPAHCQCTLNVEMKIILIFVAICKGVKYTWAGGRRCDLNIGSRTAKAAKRYAYLESNVAHFILEPTPTELRTIKITNKNRTKTDRKKS